MSIDRKRGHASRFGGLGWASRRIRAHAKMSLGGFARLAMIATVAATFGLVGFAKPAGASHKVCSPVVVGGAVEGKILLGNKGVKLVYEAGYLFGLTRSTPDGTFKWLFEVEFPF